jgi:nickel transport protein
MKLAWLLLVAAALLAGSRSAAAHEVHHTVSQSGAVVIQLAYGDGTPFSFEGYEIFRAGEELPVQVGRTDVRGRIAFLPDAPGTWRLRAFADDGHGCDVSFETSAASMVGAVDRPLYQRFTRPLVGVSLIFGVFGLVSLFYRRRKP